MPLAALQCVALDCPDPRALAEFYRTLLGGEVDRPDPRWRLDADWSTLHPDSGPVLGFQRASEYRPPRWPDPEHPQQLHLDLTVSDLDGARAAVLAAGGTVLAPMEHWLVCADPAGHPFCLLPT